MHLQSLGGDNEDGECGLQPCLPAFDIKEFLSAKVGSEACLGNGVVAVGEGEFGGKHRRTSVGNVCKGASVDESWCLLGGLYEIGMDGIDEQGCDGSRDTEVVDGEGTVIDGDAEENVADAPLQVFNVGSKTKDSHQFGSRGDVEARGTLYAVGTAANADVYMTEAAVVDIEYAFPIDFLEEGPFIAMLVEMIVEQRAERVVGRGDGMEVAGEVEIDFLHRQHLRIASSCSSALDSETGTQ